MKEKNEEKLGKAPSSLIFISLASMYLDNGMVDEAIDLCKAGLEIEPHNEEAHLILAKAEIEKGNMEKAKERLIKLLEENPENSSAKILLEEIKQKLPEEKFKKEEEETREKEITVSETHSIMEIEKGEEEEFRIEKEKIKKFPEEVKKPPDMEIKKQPQKIEKSTIDKETEELKASFLKKIKKITQIKGVINCFFRLEDGSIVRTPQLIGNIEDLLPLLDSLLNSIKSAGSRLKVGKLDIIMLEIENGVFYIFEKENYDCFLFSHKADNFGLLKALLPKILE